MLLDSQTLRHSLFLRISNCRLSDSQGSDTLYTCIRTQSDWTLRLSDSKHSDSLFLRLSDSQTLRSSGSDTSEARIRTQSDWTLRLSGSQILRFSDSQIVKSFPDSRTLRPSESQTLRLWLSDSHILRLRRCINMHTYTTRLDSQALRFSDSQTSFSNSQTVKSFPSSQTSRLSDET